MADEASESWRAWLGQHGPALVLFARQWCGSHADAEDAVQNGFVKFWKSRARSRDETAYLYSCVRTAARDLSRGQRRRRQREDLATPPEEALLESTLERDEQRAAVEQALQQLPPEQREVLVMKIWGGLTFAQIAESLGISINTAASRYRYALERLEPQLMRELAHG